MHVESNYLELAARGLVKLSQSLISPSTVPPPETLIFMTDHSGSMSDPCGRRNRLGAAQEAMIALLDARLACQIKDTVAVICFDDTAQLALPFTPCEKHLDKIRSAIRSITIAGGTDLAAPLVLANKILRNQTNVHIILLSDGHGGSPIREARKLKDRGAVIETIGVGNEPSEVDEVSMRAIASVLNGKVLYRFIRDADEMTTYFRTEIANRLVKRSDP